MVFTCGFVCTVVSASGSYACSCCVDQDVSPGKCVLLSTSKSVRRAVKLWDISGDGKFWKVQLDNRDLGGHLDFTRRARAGTLS